MEFKNLRKPNITKISRGYNSKSLTVSYFSILHHFQLLLLILQSICLLSYSVEMCFCMSLFISLFDWFVCYSFYLSSFCSFPFFEKHSTPRFTQIIFIVALEINEFPGSESKYSCKTFFSPESFEINQTTFGRFMSSKLIFSNNLRILVKFLKF